MDYIGWIIFIIVFGELALYFIKFFPFIHWNKNKHLKFLYFYGIPLKRHLFNSKYQKDEIIQYINNYIKPLKKLDESVFVTRRKYLKILQWYTPVFIEARLTISQDIELGTVIDTEFKMIYFPWIAILASILMSFGLPAIEIASNIFASLFTILFFYLFALLERYVLIKKLEKIKNMDTTYYLFA